MAAHDNVWLPTNIVRARKDTEENANVEKTADQFRERFDGKNASVTARKEKATTLVNEYYDLVTDFYEFGWGQAFHFAPRFAGETFNESLIRHEHHLAKTADFKPSHKVLDIGCGVGGPLRNMVRFANCHITGINNNEYQISRGRRYDQRLGLDNKTDYIRTDFNNMPLANGFADGAYAIEATCHAADKVKCYSEVFRVLKPGAAFVAYEWIITDKYDHGNEKHRKVRHGIELGNALPTLATAQEVVAALKEAGFEVEESYDYCQVFEDGPAKTVPWYEPLQGNYTSLSGFRASHVGRWCTSMMIKGMEIARIAPAGSYKTSMILEEAAVNLVVGGQMQIFTPSFYFRARKPLK